MRTFSPVGVLLTRLIFDESAAGCRTQILRCRINAAFRRQVERRIYAAEGVPEEIFPTPVGALSLLPPVQLLNTYR
jgi:hypothetical protein